MKLSAQAAKLLFIIPFLVLSLSCMRGDGMLTFADDDFFVRQGAGQCGPTSFYMIFRYYGDTAFQGEFTELPDCAEILFLQEELAEVTEDSAVSRWLGVTNTGIAIRDLKESISRLTVDRNYPWYITAGDNEKTDILQEARFTIIYNSFLKNDLPVIIHLSRPDVSGIPVTGHYMVLVGYDPQHQTVYYVDPNRNADTPVVQCVGLYNFLHSGWYESPDSSLLPDGYWDGTWIGFRHAQQ